MLIITNIVFTAPWMAKHQPKSAGNASMRMRCSTVSVGGLTAVGYTSCRWPLDYHFAIDTCELGTEVARVCGCSDLSIHHADALDITTFSRYDCGIASTVVGILEAEKQQIIEHYLRWVPSSTTLIFRTATGPGQVIYPAIDKAMLCGMDYHILGNPPQKTFTMIVTDRRRKSKWFDKID